MAEWTMARKWRQARGWIERNTRAVSPVLGGLLLLGIVILLAVIVGTLSFGFVTHLGDPAAVAALGETAQVTVGEDETTHALQIVHRSGQTLQVEGLTAVVSAGGPTTRVPIPVTGQLADGKWSAGERVSLPLDTDAVCANDPDSVDIKIIQEMRSKRSHVISSQTVPVQPGQFVISEGSVEPTVDYSAEVKLLGTGFTYGAGGPNIPITVSVSIGEDTYLPWPGNINDAANPRTTTYSDREAGEGIVVTAEGLAHGGYSGHEVGSAADVDTFVHVLRNGSDAPDVEGFGDQEDAAAFVEDYIEDGVIVLDDNQAIYLFELSYSTENSGADFQDVVVLVSLDTTSSTVTVDENGEGEGVILCPADA